MSEDEERGNVRVLRPVSVAPDVRKERDKQAMLECLDDLRTRVEAGEIVNLVPIYETEGEINFKRPIYVEGIRLIGLFQAAIIIVGRGLGQM